MSSTGVPLFDLQIQHRTLQESIQAALARVLASGHVILGPEVAGLEEEIARFCGVGHAVGCASGTDALSYFLRYGRRRLPVGRPAHLCRYRPHYLQP